MNTQTITTPNLPLIIAEVKTRSPFGWQSNKSWEELFSVAEKFGDMLSIHTDPRWGSSFELLSTARALTNKPILAKGIHALDSDIKEAVVRGADAVLVVGRQTDVHVEKCFFEPNSLAELFALPKDCHAVWNSRDLATGGNKTEQFKEARAMFSGWLCQASNIQTIDDVRAGTDAVLVGTHLETFVRSLPTQ